MEKKLYNVGDVVRVLSVNEMLDLCDQDSDDNYIYLHYLDFDLKQEDYVCDRKAMISDIMGLDDDHRTYKLTFLDENDEYGYLFSSEMLEPTQLTKGDLQNGDRLLLRDNEVEYYADEELLGGRLDYAHLNNDLLNMGSCGKELDVIAVHRPVKYKQIFSQNDRTIKMTKKEIEQKLGYKIEIVEGE